MQPIKWIDEKYSVGHPQIDAQHKVLLKQLNSLIVLQKQRFNQSKQKQIILDLERYIDKHLRFEESLLKEAGYEDYDRHVQLHSQYMMEVEMWILMIDDDDPSLPKRICAFLAEWFKEHILGEDMKYRTSIQKLID